MSERRLSVGAPRNAFVPSPVFLGVVALVLVSGYLTWHRIGNVRVDVFVMVLSIWLLSLCLHEYAHAVVAYFSGDLGVAERGYLRLNPLKYTHPLLSVGLPVIAVILGGIGLPGGAVWVDHQHVRGRIRHSLISAASPAVNVVFALLLALPLVLGAGGLEVTDDGYFMGGSGTVAHLEFWAALALSALLQVTASVLNLLPVPGLDGGNLIHPWLSPQWQRGYNLMAPYGFILLFALLWQPRINGWFFTAVHWVAGGVGVPRALSEIGFALMRFWQ